MLHHIQKEKYDMTAVSNSFLLDIARGEWTFGSLRPSERRTKKNLRSAAHVAAVSSLITSVIPLNPCVPLLDLRFSASIYSHHVFCGLEYVKRRCAPAGGLFCPPFPLFLRLSPNLSSQI